MLDPRELLETILIDFGLDPGGRSKALLLRDLSQFLVDQRVAGRMVLLVIDEAQNLSLAALEELRMLSNLETEKSKLVQIVMVGQPNLRDKLASPEVEQLRQRITVTYHLPPLDIDETANYINHRLRCAALGAPMTFPREATDLIYGRSRGVPRIINVIGDATLLFGYAEERRAFDAATIGEVLVELETTGVLLPSSLPPSPHAAAAGPPQAAAAPPPGTVSAPWPAPPSPEAARAASAPAQAAVPVSELRMPTSTAALDEREARIRQREMELAEQHRVLEEECRLLRAQRHPVPFEPPPEGFWMRVKRFMLGVSTSAS
jgi:hypothetical protein